MSHRLVKPHRQQQDSPDVRALSPNLGNDYPFTAAYSPPPSSSSSRRPKHAKIPTPSDKSHRPRHLLHRDRDPSRSQKRLSSATQPRADSAEMSHLLDPSYSGSASPAYDNTFPRSGTYSSTANKVYVDAQGQLHDPDYRIFDLGFSNHAPSSRQSSQTHAFASTNADNNRAPSYSRSNIYRSSSRRTNASYGQSLEPYSTTSASFRDPHPEEDAEDDDEYDSDADINARSRYNKSLQSRRFSSTLSDSGYARSVRTQVAGTSVSPSSPPVMEDAEFNSEDIDPSLTTKADSPPKRPTQRREISRNSLYPRTAANMYYKSQLEGPILPVATLVPPPEDPLPTSILSTTHLMDKDDPYRDIVISEKDSLDPDSSAKKKHRKKNRREERKSSEGVDISGDRGAAEDVGALKEGRTSAFSPTPASRRQSALPSDSTPVVEHADPLSEAGGYLPSRHGKSRPIYDGGTFQPDDYSPGCSDGMKRSWQSFKLSLRFGMFRTRRKIQRRVGM